MAAASVDLSGDPPADQRRIIRMHHVANEFMARDAAKIHIAARQLEIGAADAGQINPHDTFARHRLRIGIVLLQAQAVIEDERAHRSRIETEKPPGILPRGSDEM